MHQDILINLKSQNQYLSRSNEDSTSLTYSRRTVVKSEQLFSERALVPANKAHIFTNYAAITILSTQFQQVSAWPFSGHSYYSNLDHIHVKVAVDRQHQSISSKDLVHLFHVPPRGYHSATNNTKFPIISSSFRFISTPPMLVNCLLNSRDRQQCRRLDPRV